MPELPEVETVCRGIAPALEGAVIARAHFTRPDLRFPLPEGLAARLSGRRVRKVRRRAKYGLIELEDESTLLFHLGMSGRMRLDLKGEDRPALGKHDHAIFETDAGDRLVFTDPRRFGFFDFLPPGETDRHPALAPLGPEPLSNAFSSPVLAAALERKRTPIKAALLDQRVVAGLGNIYVCEALNLARCSPRRLAANLGARRIERLVPAIKTVLDRAIDAGGSSLKDYRRADGALGYFQHEFRAYGRAGARCRSPGCDGIIKRIAQGGRSTFYCPRCQS